MKEFVDSFLNEAGDLLNNIEANLFELEKQSDNEELIQEIFRGMHTIKGAAGMYGYDKTGQLTHSLESIYDEIRDNKRLLDSNIINDTFKAIDILRCFLSSEEKECPKQFEELISKLDSKLNSDNEEILVSPKKQQETKSQLFYVFFTPDEQIYFRGINPQNVLEEVYELGNYFEIIHDGGIPLEKQYEKKKCVAKWESYIFTDKSKEDIEEIFMFFDDHEFSVGELSSDEIRSDVAYLADLEKCSIKKEQTDFEKIIAFYTENSKEKDKSVEESEKIDAPQNNEESKFQSTSGDAPKLEKGIFVSSDKLDDMMNLVSELVTTNARLELISGRLKDGMLNDVSEKIHRLSKQFRDNALDIRLVPIKILYQQFQRLVRDLCNQLGKDVEFIAEGMDTELDKTIIKALESPLLHIIRNSIDHGIEYPEERKKNNKSTKGLLRFMSFYSGSQVIIQIQDDGTGINLEKVKNAAIKKGLLEPDQIVTDKELLEMIIRPGFSTAEKISMVSGRGVGMDVVNKEVSAVNGSLEINTEKGLGTIITINIPVTLSIIDTLLVTVDNFNFLIQVSDIIQCYTEQNDTLLAKEIKQIEFEGEKIPFVDIRQIFGLATNPPSVHKIIVINKNNQLFAIMVDKIIGDHQAVLKPLGRMFKENQYLSGASILGDGSLSYVLDTVKLLSYAEKKYNINLV